MSPGVAKCSLGLTINPGLRIAELNSRRSPSSGASVPWGEAGKHVFKKKWPEDDECLIQQKRVPGGGASSGWVTREGDSEVLLDLELNVRQEGASHAKC